MLSWGDDDGHGERIGWLVSMSMSMSIVMDGCWTIVGKRKGIRHSISFRFEKKKHTYINIKKGVVISYFIHGSLALSGICLYRRPFQSMMREVG